MDYFLDLLTNHRAMMWANLLLCLIGLAWTAGVDSKIKDPRAWLSWIGFWAGTGFYYLLAVINPEIVFWIPGLGLYFATLSLIYGHFRWVQMPSKYALILSAVTVIVSAIIDIQLVKNGMNSGVHQSLTAIVIGGWAWRLSAMNEGQSIVLLTYAIIQLPLQPILSHFGMSGEEYFDFVGKTFAIYAAMKLAIIPAICRVSKKNEIQAL